MTNEEAIKFGKLIIEIAEQCDDKESENTIEFTKLAVESLENQKTGHWTETDMYVYECSECGCKLVDEQIYIPRNFCPNCGAKMEGE